MMATMIVLAVTYVPLSPERLDYADVVEINRVYDHNANLKFVQAVGWNDEGVDWWRIFNSDVSPRGEKKHRLPVARKIGGRFHVTFVDPKDGTLRRVICRSVWHSWTQHDREMEDRECRPNKFRRELNNPPKFPPGFSSN